MLAPIMDIDEIRKFVTDWRTRDGKRTWFEIGDPYQRKMIDMIEFLLSKLDDNYPKG